MLTTIIYRSHISADVPVKILPGMVEKASLLNESHQVTGILLFNGTHFFQILEGPEEGVMTIYNRICADRRHHNVVELMRDYSPYRRFGNSGMELFDLREHDQSTVLQAVLDRGTSRFRLTYDDRGLQFLRTFVESREKENYFEVLPADLWDFIPDMTGSLQEEHGIHFRPVVDPLGREITALEAISDSPESAGEDEDKYIANLNAVRMALMKAGKACPDGMTLYLTILPMTLVAVPNAVDTITDAIKNAGLVPEQIILGVSETEVIPGLNDFTEAVKQLKQAGISLSIDNFGDGSAGLSLLTHVQPDRVRIASGIIRDVHRSGPKQAVVQAIIKCCSALEINVIASGIEQPEEWMWLEAAGVIDFQGSLFTPQGTSVSWPEYRAAM
ncbi:MULTISPECIES: diguanylate phosphodiesterase [Pantoea]|jgi:EAL domain-containing protein (putative c-di-GMP-specific phosphodiesterase class I)|uniref:Diguanylate phosphodiesterase n=1 Tax=Pantoea eucrina TaxID=472693 RepID=A0ABS1ZA16_9GAMM|nr:MULTISPECIES: diguanylate phosphodiesterase [Pantoea]AJA71225.1 diguanylate phosphodiesterase [Pantoea sp. PSNIH1]QNH53123.1 diguanylate phosphodiesterase [Acinetobacter venetianus]KAA6044419.1 diguanylate phosphodiesterase [Pantoea sp. Bo_7]KAA6090196.1 diguanylate phosphodiesterase [Pantoea sp. Bo_10]MBM0749258.1 diguanylate phosphodiesterase [Pantoea eucrina]